MLWLIVNLVLTLWKAVVYGSGEVLYASSGYVEVHMCMIGTCNYDKSVL